MEISHSPSDLMQAHDFASIAWLQSKINCFIYTAHGGMHRSSFTTQLSIKIVILLISAGHIMGSCPIRPSLEGSGSRHIYLYCIPVR